jgi:peptidyl-tRNA hydrolase, PTH1 family
MKWHDSFFSRITELFSSKKETVRDINLLKTYLLVGLGNPGIKYEKTRHNIGFRVINSWVDQNLGLWKANKIFKGEIAICTRGSVRVIALKPQTFMNLTGESVQAACRFYKLKAEQCICISDEVQIPLGGVKLALKGSAGGHNGLLSIKTHLHHDFWRFRVGIGKKSHPDMDLSDYVLSSFNSADEIALANRMPEILEKLNLLIDKGPHLAINTINQNF